MVSPRGPRWTPATTEFKLADLPEAPEPAATAKARLNQMRQLARRFTVQEELLGGEKVECRLLPQPIDRYADEQQGIVDGALFAFANGTNPEAGLFLECGAKGWSYGVIRLSAASLFASLDGKQFFTAPKSPDLPPTAPYRGENQPVKLPE
jgi:hypothetical protein